MNLDKELDKISPAPWERHGWTGELTSPDGTPTDDFTRNDVARVVWFATTTPGWDGETTGCVQLRDGRFVAWEADWGPTGDGFFRDAYGGTSDLVFAKTEKAALAAMSLRARDLLLEAK